MRLTPRPTAIMLFMRTRGLAPRFRAWRARGLLLTYARMRHPRVARGPTTWKVVVLLLHQCCVAAARTRTEIAGVRTRHVCRCTTAACRQPDSNRQPMVESHPCLPLLDHGANKTRRAWGM